MHMYQGKKGAIVRVKGAVARVGGPQDGATGGGVENTQRHAVSAPALDSARARVWARAWAWASRSSVPS
ncbi:hypothetical protein STSP_38360 [Streptomyces jeddahensis]|uniref:Uncharacterized protein n=1 Tax=Streptomyces jeddahensis TaxID=1716141 RepID=A0A177HQC1_9ACTN|nr:hypothetical protein STSP_38360 [Streptomyces jeddahensis]